MLATLADAKCVTAAKWGFSTDFHAFFVTKGLTPPRVFCDGSGLLNITTQSQIP